MKYRNSHSAVIIAAREEPIIRVLERALKGVGVDVERAHSHRQLLRKCNTRHYRLIISRFVAPLVQSRGEVARLRGCGPATHLFVLSHTRDERVVVTLLERGVSQFLSLPVSLSRLMCKIEQELHKDSWLC